MSAIKRVKLGPDGFDHLFDCRNAENNLTIGAPGPDTLLKAAGIFKVQNLNCYIYICIYML